MHLKNFSLITRQGKTELSPAYDLLNSTIVLRNPQEELALPLNGKKANLTRKDFIDYLAVKRLNLTSSIIDETLKTLCSAISPWRKLIDISFLSEPMKSKYKTLLDNRTQRLSL